ncbi:MAG TPA: hypothetical protein VL442_10720 [Mucilaginibacter sp.]|jgi:hypothetical protein|nr:hypothetical protein [Mucilaginibacter sp.]
MLLAHPDSDLRKNLMVVSVDIVKILTTKQHNDSFVLVENVMEDFLKISDLRTPDMFLNSLSFLFALGLIEKKDYRIKLSITLRTEENYPTF